MLAILVAVMAAITAAAVAAMTVVVVVVTRRLCSTATHRQCVVEVVEAVGQVDGETLSHHGFVNRAWHTCVGGGGAVLRQHRDIASRVWHIDVCGHPC